MTWIVGTNSLFGNAFLVSDVCVTFKSPSGDPRFLDCLQKVHVLGRFVIGGFAGSVRIGFSMLEFLQRQFAVIPEQNAWNLDIVVNTWWPRIARRIFRLSPLEERNLGSRIILATAHPTRNRGDAAWAWTDVYSFVSPDFSPVQCGQNQVVGIGSGASVSIFMDAVQRARSDFSFHQIGQAGGWAQGRFIASAVEEAIKRNPIGGVSKFFQVGMVGRGPIEISNHEYDIFPPNGPRVEVRCPHLARNLQEFIQLAAGSGENASSAAC
jgi:hypothetical protein